MKKLKFENTDEFERVFKTHDKVITDAIVEGIQEAYSFHKKSASLMGASFGELYGSL